MVEVAASALNVKKHEAKNIILIVVVFYLLFLSACSQLRYPSTSSQDRKDNRKLINLVRLPGVKATDPKMIDGNLSTFGFMRTDYIGFLNDWVEYLKKVKTNGQMSPPLIIPVVWTVIELPMKKYVSEIKIYSQDFEEKVSDIWVLVKGDPVWIPYESLPSPRDSIRITEKEITKGENSG